MSWALGLAMIGGGVLVAALSFALSRIAIRLDQEISLAALAALLFVWQCIALIAGAAPLAGATSMLFAAAVILIVTRWLNHTVGIGLPIRTGLLLLTGALWGAAATFPVLTPWQATAFASSYALVFGGVWMAVRSARSPAMIGTLGVPSATLLAGWLAVRVYGSFFY